MSALRIGMAVAMGLALGGQAAAFELTSSSLGADGKFSDKLIANAFGCNGQNVSPQLSWKNPPAGTKSFALTMFDPDAPTGSGFWHWLVFNIPPTATELPEGAGTPDGKGLPAGTAQGRMDAGLTSYFGPCPPQGDKPHRYVFTIFAVKADNLPPDQIASGAVLGFNLNYNTIEKASVTYIYGR